MYNVIYDSLYIDSGMYSISYFSMNGDLERYEVLSYDKFVGGFEFFFFYVVFDNDRSIISG